MVQNCVFCNIVLKEIPASYVFENEKILAFMDIRPVTEGHTLVIPKTHYENIFELTDDIIEPIFKAVKKVAYAVKEGVNAEGITIFQQNGKAAGQDVFHFHVHVIPRYKDKKLPKLNELSTVKREALQYLFTQ